MSESRPSVPAIQAGEIAVDGVSKSYGSFAVLRGVTFEVRAGECFGLAGVNGAGKTTLIKCLLDFCSSDAGRIEISQAAEREQLV